MERRLESAEAFEHGPQDLAGKGDFGVAAAPLAGGGAVLAGLDDGVEDGGRGPEQAVTQHEHVPAPGLLDVDIDGGHVTLLCSLTSVVRRPAPPRTRRAGGSECG